MIEASELCISCLKEYACVKIQNFQSLKIKNEFVRNFILQLNRFL